MMVLVKCPKHHQDALRNIIGRSADSNQADLPLSSSMPPRAKPFDLKNVAKLFNDTIAAIRDDTPDFKALEPQAIEWLKAARYKLMRDLEQE
jgi:hypothetical protein